jgi:hypothetical protein
MKKHLCLLIILLLPGLIMAGEFGLVINQYAGTDNLKNEDGSFEYNALFIPRLLFLIGDGADGKPMGSFYASAGMTLGYSDGFLYVPELLRTELSMLWKEMGLRAGRFDYSAPLSFIANGLFDGIQFSHSSPAGRFSLGAWYTGLLYKKSANINMTANDSAINNFPLDYNEFTGTYFAPRRLLTSLDWEHLAIADVLRLNAAINAQFDLGDDEKYHSQYFSIKAGLPVNNLFFELGGCFATSQYESPYDSFSNLSLAGDLGIHLTLPTSFNSRLSFNAQCASGQLDDNWGCFVPVTTKETGSIFNAKMSALTVLGLNYSGLFTEKFGTNFSVKYFIRNDLTTTGIYPVLGEENDGHVLGAEFFGSLIWSPVSDLHFNLGGGTFIPALGDNWKDAKPVWLLELTLIFTVY